MNILGVKRKSTIRIFFVAILAPVSAQLIRTSDWDQNSGVRLVFGLSEKTQRKTNPKSEVAQYRRYSGSGGGGQLKAVDPFQECSIVPVRRWHLRQAVLANMNAKRRRPVLLSKVVYTSAKEWILRDRTISIALWNALVSHGRTAFIFAFCDWKFPHSAAGISK